MSKFPSAQIKIWIPGQRFVAQGKICEWGGKPAFIATMSETKWIRNGNGYAISKRILDTFSELKFNPKIVYVRPDLDTYYETTRGKFIEKGILFGYGGHSQYVLPINHWKPQSGKVVDVRKDYPSLSLEKWVAKYKLYKLPPFPASRPAVIEDLTIPDEVRLRMRDDFFAKYPDLRRVET